jgi:hypothetical protein
MVGSVPGEVDAISSQTYECSIAACNKCNVMQVILHNYQYCIELVQKCKVFLMKF